MRSKLKITLASTEQPGFERWLMHRNRTVARHERKIQKTVSRVLSAIERKGDQMVVKYAKKYDGARVDNVSELEIPKQDRQMAWERLAPDHRRGLQFAFRRITDFHQRQMNHMGDNWEHQDQDGFLTGCSKIPFKRVGIYVPGGGAVYASTVLMCAVPARIAGVEELIMMTPAHRGQHSDLVMAASTLANVDQVYSLGGAQAIAAMAYGTETIAAVNKIVGPGNRYVSLAKSTVRDRVGIDTIAGPSEVLIISDDSTNPEWVALDAFAQAEHDEEARATIISPSAQFLDTVRERMSALLPTMQRRNIIARSLAKHGLLLKTRDVAEAIKISNHIAPEHLCLMVPNSESLLIDVHHAGAIFLGDQVAQVYGDYCAGPSHVLPTGGRARFDSVLNVSSFHRYSTVVGGMPSNPEVYEMTAILARAEGLEAHARAVEARARSSSQTNQS